jgi:hypothetical protein
MPLTPQDFVSKWRRVTAGEKQTCQERCLDLVGHATSNEYDPIGKPFAFEMGMQNTIGEQGWMPGLRDEEILEKLPTLNLQRAKQNAL